MNASSKEPSKWWMVLAGLFLLLALWVLAGFVQIAALLTHGYEPQWYTPWLLLPLRVFAWIADLFG